MLMERFDKTLSKATTNKRWTIVEFLESIGVETRQQIRSRTRHRQNKSKLRTLQLVIQKSNAKIPTTNENDGPNGNIS